MGKSSVNIGFFKAWVYRVKDNLEQFAIRSLRWMLGAVKLMNLPVHRVASSKKWIQQQRAKLKWPVRMHGPGYMILYEPIQLASSKPHCPTNNNMPVHYCTNKTPKKRYVYWDIRSGFDSRKGFCYKPVLQFDEVFLVYIPNGRVLGPSGAVITPDLKLLEESIWTWDNWIKNDRSQKSWRLPHPKKLSVPCYTVVSNYAEGYPHWLMEVLPRLYGLQKLPQELNPTIIFNKDLNKWQTDSIKLLGLGDYPTISLNDQYLQCDHLYMPSYVGLPGMPHPVGCKWVRERILQNFKIEVGPIRIYISRRLATKRKLMNEEEILPVLKEFGFIEVIAEQLSFAEQVQLFMRAEAVVTPHGAGLGNLMFVPKGCKVLEILDQNYVNDHYYNLSGILELDYYYQLCTSVNADNGKSLNPGWDDITINSEKLKESLKAMFPKS